VRAIEKLDRLRSTMAVNVLKLTEWNTSNVRFAVVLISP